MRNHRRAGLVVWLTGLSGAGKSTLSDLLRNRLAEEGVAAIQLDGDTLRAGLCQDLGFSEHDRTENIRRVSEIAKLLAEQGFVVQCSFISPLKAQREFARERIGPLFTEVHVNCSLEEAILRDPKGLYRRALRGEIPEFTGITSPYDPPLAPDLRLDTHIQSKEESLEILAKHVLSQLGFPASL